MDMNIFGLGGTNGSGKDTIGHMLAERHNYLFVSLTDMLRHEAKNRGLPVEREYLRALSAEWRREHGLGVLVDKAVEFFNAHPDHYDGLVVASLRNPGEADTVHRLGGKVIWVDADPRIRYDRVQAHKLERNRAEEDNRTFEQFLADEAAEMTPSGDEATLNMAGVKALSDTTVLNEGTDVARFKDDAENILGLTAN